MEHLYQELENKLAIAQSALEDILERCFHCQSMGLNEPMYARIAAKALKEINPDRNYSAWFDCV